MENNSDYRRCQICFTGYSDDEDHSPHIMPCGHTTCAKCLKSILSQYITKRACPFCMQQLNSMRFNDYPKNFALVMKNDLPKPEKVRTVCFEHGLEETVICLDCKIKCCQKCYFRGQHKGHASDVLEDFVQESTKVVTEMKSLNSKIDKRVNEINSLLDEVMFKYEKNIVESYDKIISCLENEKHEIVNKIQLQIESLKIKNPWFDQFNVSDDDIKVLCDFHARDFRSTHSDMEEFTKANQANQLLKDSKFIEIEHLINKNIIPKITRMEQIINNNFPADFNLQSPTKLRKLSDSELNIMNVQHILKSYVRPNFSAFKMQKALKGHFSSIMAINYCPISKKIISASNDKTIKIWNQLQDKCLLTIQTKIDEVLSLTISPNGKYVAAPSNENTLRVWDIETGELVTSIQDEEDLSYRFWGACFSQDSLQLITCGNKSEIKIMDLESGTCLKALNGGHKSGIKRVLLSPDGNLIVSCGNDGKICIWNAEEGNLISQLEGHEGAVLTLDFSPDSKRLISGGTDKSVRVWDIQSQQCINVIIAHTDDVISVSFSNDETSIVSGSLDNTIKIWDPTNSSQCIATLTDKIGEVRDVKFSPDGQMIASASRTGSVKLWSC